METLDKNLIKAHLQKIDMMIEMLETEEKQIRKRETEIVCDLEGLYKKKDDLLMLLSGSEFNASLLDEDWDIHGTLSMRTKLLDNVGKDLRKVKKERREKMVQEWKRKSSESKKDDDSDDPKEPGTPKRSVGFQ